MEKPLATFKIGKDTFEVWPKGSTKTRAARQEVGEMEYKGKTVLIYRRLFNSTAD